MTTRVFEPGTAVYTPPEVAKYGIDAIRGMDENRSRGLKYPVAEMDQYVAPLLPGQVAAVIAQTSNAKSLMLHFWERRAAEQLAAEGRGNEVIIHVSVEETVEEQAFIFLAREANLLAEEQRRDIRQTAGQLASGNVQDWTLLQTAATRVGGILICRIGSSLARAEDMPELYLSNMVKAIKALTEGKVTGEKITPAALFFDYLQAFPFDPEIRRTSPSDQRRLQVREDVYRLRLASGYFACPVVVGVQAKQHLDGAPGADFQLPGIYDGEETSSIAQRFDRIITQWLPKMTHPVGKVVNHGDLSFEVTENLLWQKVAKQRGGLPSGKTWPCFVDYDTTTIYPAEFNGFRAVLKREPQGKSNADNHEVYRGGKE